MQRVGSFATHHSRCHLQEIKEIRRLHTDDGDNVPATAMWQQGKPLQGSIWGTGI